IPSKAMAGVTPEQLDAFVRPVEASRVPWITLLGNGRHDLAIRDTNALVPLRHVPGLTLVTDRPEIVPVGAAPLACMPWQSTGRLKAQADRLRLDVGDVDNINEFA